VRQRVSPSEARPAGAASRCKPARPLPPEPAPARLLLLPSPRRRRRERGSVARATRPHQQGCRRASGGIGHRAERVRPSSSPPPPPDRRHTECCPRPWPKSWGHWGGWYTRSIWREGGGGGRAVERVGRGAAERVGRGAVERVGRGAAELVGRGAVERVGRGAAERAGRGAVERERRPRLCGRGRRRRLRSRAAAAALSPPAEPPTRRTRRAALARGRSRGVVGPATQDPWGVWGEAPSTKACKTKLSRSSRVPPPPAHWSTIPPPRWVEREV